MRLFRRGKVWWCSWTEASVTVKRSTRCTTRPAAELIASRWERERADPAHAAQNQATFSVEAQVFLDALRKKKKPDGSPIPAGTLNMYDCKVGHLVRLLPQQLAALDVTAVDQYFHARSGEGASMATLYKEWVALKGVLRSAARRNLYVRDIAVLKPVWVTAAYTPRERFLTWVELDALVDELAEGGKQPGNLAARNPRVPPIERACAVAFICGAGPRRAEFWRARAEDIDLAKMRVFVRGTKTAASKREIPVPPEYTPLLLAAAVYLGGKKGGTFDRWQNARRDLANACRRIGERTAQAAGREAEAWREYFAPVTFNDLRRSFGSLLVQGGTSNEVVAKLMGHTTTAMVDRVYGRQTAASLEALLRSRPGRRREGDGDA